MGSSWSSSGWERGLGSSSNGAVGRAKGDDGAGDCGSTGAVGAVPDPVAEIDVAAEAGWVWGGAAEGGILGEHVVHASLLDSKSVIYGA